jgi:hypothetical protein
LKFQFIWLGTIQQLILRKQELKLSVYKSFMFIAIGICMWFWVFMSSHFHFLHCSIGFFIFLISIGIAVLVFLLYMSFSISKDWKNKWLRDGVSDLLFYITLFSIVILWRPRKNNTLYVSLILLTFYYLQ